MGTALMVAGTALTVSSQLAAGRAAKKAADYNASVNERNADAADIQAEQIERFNKIKTLQDREKFKKLNDRTQMAFRGQGWAASTGTPLKKILQNALRFEQDIEIQNYNSRVKQQQAKEVATNLRLQAQLKRMEGKAAREISKYQAAGTLLTNTGYIISSAG
jgi:mannitol-specific phosphotransferase system IIBC component